MGQKFHEHVVWFNSSATISCGTEVKREIEWTVEKKSYQILQ